MDCLFIIIIFFTDTNDKQTKNQGDLEAQNQELIHKLKVATLKNEELELKNRQLTSSGKIMQILTQSSATIYKNLCPEVIFEE